MSWCLEVATLGGVNVSLRGSGALLNEISAL